jgi:hypothetical protein
MSLRDTIKHEKRFLPNPRKQGEIVIPGNPGEGRGDPESRSFQGSGLRRNNAVRVFFMSLLIKLFGAEI